MIVTKLFEFQQQIASTKMFRDNTLKCRVCGAYCSQQDWDRSRTCTSCQEFYQRSTEKMNRYLYQTNPIELFLNPLSIIQ